MLYKDFVKEKVNNEIRIKSAEGYPCEFERSKGRPLKDYKIYGESVQNGEPTPDNPIEIESVGELSEKNLWSFGDIEFTTYVKLTFSPALPAGDYTLTADVMSTDVDATLRYLRFTTADDKLLAHRAFEDIKGNTFSFTADADIAYVQLYASDKYANGINDVCTYTNVQLETGSTATEYEPYGKYKIPVTVRGKNLIKYPYSQTTKTENGITFTDNGDGTIAASGTATQAVQLRLMDWTTFDKTKKYYISGSPSGGGWSTHGIYISFWLNGTWKKELLENGNGLLLDLPNMTVEFNQIQINCAVWNGATVENITFKPQLEEGSTATEYEPYKGSITEHIYLDEPLRKIGDYADYIDFKNQKIVRQIKYIRLEPTLNYNIWTYNDVFFGFHVYLTESIKECMALSNYFKPVTDNKLPSHKDNSIYLRGELYIGTADWTTVDDFKAWLSDNIAYVAYVLKTTTEEPISLPTLKTVKGTNIMSVDTSILPSNIKTKYVRL